MMIHNWAWALRRVNHIRICFICIKNLMSLYDCWRYTGQWQFTIKNWICSSAPLSAYTKHTCGQNDPPEPNKYIWMHIHEFPNLFFINSIYLLTHIHWHLNKNYYRCVAGAIRFAGKDGISNLIIETTNGFWLCPKKNRWGVKVDFLLIRFSIESRCELADRAYARCMVILCILGWPETDKLGCTAFT